MPLSPMLSRRAALAGTAALLGAAHARAQTYPVRPVLVVIPWTPGGPADAIMRPIGEKLAEALGQPFVIENRPGANGTVGANAVAKAQPDGYTLFFSHVGPVAISPALQKLPYDPKRDLAPITLIASGPLMLIVRNDLPVRSVTELVAYAKNNPGKLTFGTVGPGSTTHLAAEMLKLLGGVEMTHVPYRGSAPIVTDMLSGRIDLAFMNIAGALPYVQAGQLRGIAVTTKQRSGVVPDLPTVAETYPSFEVNSWYGLMAPAGTPRPIIDRLHRETSAIVKTPDIAKRLNVNGMDPEGMGPDDYAAKIGSDLDSWAQTIKAADIKL